MPASSNNSEERLSQLMRRAQTGDGEAYLELLEAIRVVLQVYARRVLARMGSKDAAAAEDLVQEALVALHDKRHTYDPAQPFLPWLFSIARYKLIDHGRKRRREAGWAQLETVEHALEAPVFSEASTAADLEALLKDLPPKSRQLLELVKLEGLSVAEAAARTNMSESAVKVAVHRTLKRLREKLSKGERT